MYTAYAETMFKDDYNGTEKFLQPKDHEVTLTS